MRRLLLFSVCLAELAAGQQLRVKSANARSVQLEWTGTTGPVTIERTSGITVQKIAATDPMDYEDKTIDRFATYRYRVSAGGKTSNEVIVGPPPSGVTNAAPLPKGADPGKFGQASAMALDENGDPVIAFEWLDPNGDGDFSDNEVRVVHWSRATYRWLASVRALVVGDISNQNLNPISIACDRKTGLLAVVTPVGDKSASMVVSKDGGATWSATPIPEITDQIYATAIAIVNGQIHLVLTSGDDHARYLSGPVDDISSWKTQPLPSSSGWKQPQNVNVSLVIDPSGKAVIAWFETQEEGDGHRYKVWREGGSANTALETKRGADSPNLAFTAGGGKFGLLVAATLDEKDDDHGVWYLQSADGASWSKPSKLPVDGPRSTNPPFDVALDSHGHIVAAFSANSGSDSTTCNYPVLSRSTDGNTWKTCGPGKAEGGNFDPQPPTLHAIEGENDKVYVLWPQSGENKYRQGMLLWHEH
jgi:hypothetical protein